MHMTIPCQRMGIAQAVLHSFHSFQWILDKRDFWSSMVSVTDFLIYLFICVCVFDYLNCIPNCHNKEHCIKEYI